MSADTPYDRLRRLLPEGDEVGLDGYRVLHPIGEGGFGRVFLARQLAFDRDVAIKVLSATGLRDETARRFERECRAVGALSAHPHIVTIYDSGITPWGRPYIVMEHMSGGSVAQRIATEGPLDSAEALDVIVKICGAVAAAHRNGIVHRDIKPENLLISEYGEPVLADFGIASIPGGYQTHTGAISASLAHAAPEVLDGAKASPATDIYSIGSTLFTLIAGCAPFESPEHPGLQALIARTMTQPVPDLREQAVPDDICTAIETAMSKDPTERFARPEDLASALQQAQAAHGLPTTEMLVPHVGFENLVTEEPPPAEEARTVARPRTVLDPPAPPVPRRRPRWRSPVTAAALTLLLALGAGGTVALRVRRPAASPATQVAGVPPTPTLSPDPDPAPPVAGARADQKKLRKEAERRGPRRKPKNGGRIAFAGGAVAAGEGAGSAGTAPAASSSNNYTNDGTGTRSPSGADGGGSSGGESKPAADKEPPPPDPANKILYHLYNENGDYYFTASISQFNEKRFEYDYSHREAAVWEAGGSGMRRVCFGDGRCGGSVYIQKPSGIETRPLYSFTGPLGDYYTTDKSEIPAEYSGYRVYLYGYVQ